MNSEVLEQNRRPAAVVADPVAAAVANASLLGLGYLMLDRRWLLLIADSITLVLIVLLAGVVQTVWFEAIVLVWWAAMVVHGWYLAGGRPRRPRWTGWSAVRRRAFARPMVVAVSITTAVLVVFGLVRVDDMRIGHAVTTARESGDCAAAQAALRGRWFGDYVADAPLAADGDRTDRACQRIDRSTADFRAVLIGGDIPTLNAGLDGLATVLTTLPGHDNMVDRALQDFLGRLPTGDACQTDAILRAMGTRHRTGTVLDRAIDVAAKLGPAAVVACQLVTVRHLLTPQYPGAQPAYCTSPHPYSAAPAYSGPGPNRALLFGNDNDTKGFPDEWRAHDPTDAVLVICADPTVNGDPVQTCTYSYHGTIRPIGQDESTAEVTFHKKGIPLHAYEIRTGKLISASTVQIAGASCPDPLHYTSYDGIDAGPPRDMPVTPSPDDIRAAFAPLINPHP